MCSTALEPEALLALGRYCAAKAVSFSACKDTRTVIVVGFCLTLSQTVGLCK